MGLNIHAEQWDFPIVGFEVLEVRFSGQLHIVAYGDDGGPGRAASWSSIAYGGSFTLDLNDRDPLHLDASGPWTKVVPVLELRHARVASATAFRNGQLEIRFDDGSALIAESDSDYENWEINGPDALNVVAQPGGGVSIISS
jgi:hypothetical protein